jgi:hypothetical protein
MKYAKSLALRLGSQLIASGPHRIDGTEFSFFVREVRRGFAETTWRPRQPEHLTPEQKGQYDAVMMELAVLAIDRDARAGGAA